MKIQKFRKSLFTKATCLLLAFTFLIIGCSPESTGAIDVPIEDNCSYFENDLLTNADVADSFENALELARTINYQEDYTTYAEFHGDLFGESEETNTYVDFFESESSLYQSLGMEGYLSSKSEVSDNLSNYFISYSSTLEKYLAEAQPDLEELTSFFTNQKNLALNSDLCDTDKGLMSFYLNVSQGYAQFYYKHYYDPSATGTELRGCNFWEAIGCGLLALFVGAVVTVATAAVALVGGELTVNGQKANDEFIALAALALGIYTGVSVYDWCCGNDEIEEQECVPPSNSIIRITPCGEIQYRLWGTSTYGPTEWSNDNTNPSVITTDFPNMIIAVPNVGEPSTMNALVSCVENQTSVSIFEWEEEVLFEEGEIQGPVELVWNILPPPSANLGIPFPMSVDITGDFDPNKHELQWSISKPSQNSIQAFFFYADATINSSNGGLITVSMLDQCTGQTVASLSYFVEAG